MYVSGLLGVAFWLLSARLPPVTLLIPGTNRFTRLTYPLWFELSHHAGVPRCAVVCAGGGGNGGRMGDDVGSGGKFGGVTPVGDGILWFRTGTLSRNRDREVHNSFDMSSVELFSFGMTDTVGVNTDPGDWPAAAVIRGTIYLVGCLAENG